MDFILPEVILIILLILLNGFFALSEIALLSVKKSRLRYLASTGNRRAKRAVTLTAKSPEMLSAIQIAITVIGIFAGAFGGATVAEHIAQYLSVFPAVAAYGEEIGLAIVVIVITYFSLVIGELVPKQMALSDPEKYSLLVAGFIDRVMRIANPLVRFLSFSSRLVLKLLYIRPAVEQAVTEDEIKILIAEGAARGSFNRSEQKMVENIFNLGNYPIRRFMVPNRECVWLEAEDSWPEIRLKISGSGAPAYLVRDGKTVGLVNAEDVLIALLRDGNDNLDLRSLMNRLAEVKASAPSFEVIERLKRSSAGTAAVIEEGTGEVVGIVSLRNILKIILGGSEAEVRAIRKKGI